MAMTRYYSLIGGALLGGAVTLPALQTGVDGGVLVALASAALAALGVTLHLLNDHSSFE